MTALLEKVRPGDELGQGTSLNGAARHNARLGYVWGTASGESCAANPRTIRDGDADRTVRVEPRARNVLRFSGNSLRNERLDLREITQAVATTLSNVPAKEIADATGGSIRAAQNVREGLNAMSLAGFLNACRAFPELRALAMEMMGCEAETDPEFVKGLSLLVNSYVRRAQEGV